MTLSPRERQDLDRWITSSPEEGDGGFEEELDELLDEIAEDISDCDLTIEQARKLWKDATKPIREHVPEGGEEDPIDE